MSGYGVDDILNSVYSGQGALEIRSINLWKEKSKVMYHTEGG